MRRSFVSSVVRTALCEGVWDECAMPSEIVPKATTRAAAYVLRMNAPNPMLTVFKTLDVKFADA